MSFLKRLFPYRKKKLYVKIREAIQNPSTQRIVLNEEQMNDFGLGDKDLEVFEINQSISMSGQMSNSESAVSTQAYLLNAGQVEITVNEITVDDAIRMADAESRNQSRRLILHTLVPSMLIIPFVLIVVLVLPGIGLPPGQQRSDKLQGALLAAIAGDIVGLYVIVTRNLFPVVGRDNQ